jgi:predicted aspartyl protease
MILRPRSGDRHPGRPRALLLCVAILAAAATVGAQKRLTPKEAADRYARATHFFADARYEDAYKQYNEVFSTGEADLTPNALKGMIRSALRLSSFEIARREADALKAAANDEDALTLFGDALWGGGLFDEAETAYRDAGQRFPNSARARFGVARSLAARGRLDAALTEALTALTAAPNDPEILVLTAELYERLFRYDDAARLYEAYVKVLPSRLRDDSEVAALKIRLLRSFSGRRPVAMTGGEQLTTVPFTMRDRKVVVEGRLNGKPMEFVLDTGADRTAVTGTSADRAGIRGIIETMITGVGAPGIRRLSVGRADTIAIGDLTMRDVPVSIRRQNIPGTQSWQNETFSPMALGLSVVVDYARREVSFARQIPVEPADFHLPLRVYRLPLVRGLVNDKYPASFIVDTGGEMLSISKDMATQLAMRPTRRIGLKVWGIMGLDPDAFVLPGVNLNFETIEYQKFAVAVLNLRAPSVLLGFQLGGVLGYAFLNEYRVAMDFARGELRLQRSSIAPSAHGDYVPR